MVDGEQTLKCLLTRGGKKAPPPPTIIEERRRHCSATSFIQQAALFTITRRPLFSRHHLPSQKSLQTAYNSAALTDHPRRLFQYLITSYLQHVVHNLRVMHYNIGPDVYRRNQGTVSPTDVLIESILTNLGKPFEKTKEVEWLGKEYLQTRGGAS